MNEIDLLREAAAEELRKIEAITGPMDRVYAEAIRTAFKGGAAFGAKRALSTKPHKKGQEIPRYLNTYEGMELDNAGGDWVSYASHAERVEALENTARLYKDDGASWCNKFHDLTAYAARLEAVLVDMRDHGLRFDLNPTLDHHPERVAFSYLAYIKRMDKSIRERAEIALEKPEKTEPPCLGPSESIHQKASDSSLFTQPARVCNRCGASGDRVGEVGDACWEPECDGQIEAGGKGHRQGGDYAALKARFDAWWSGFGEHYDDRQLACLEAFVQGAKQLHSPCHSVPDAWAIVFDDAEVPPEFFAGAGATEGARKRFEQISGSWNAHLYRRVESNSRDAGACLSPCHGQEPK